MHAAVQLLYLSLIQYCSGAVLGNNPPVRSVVKLTSTPSGSIFFFGGFDGTLYRDDFFELNPKGVSWTQHSGTGARPEGRIKSGIAARSDKVYVMGGWGYYGAISDVVEYTISTDSWTKLSCFGAAPSGRENMGVTATADGLIYYFGGFDGSAYYGDMYVLDTRNGACSWTMISAGGVTVGARAGMGFVTGSDGALYLYGGYSGSYLSDFYRFSPSSQTWSALYPSGDTPTVNNGVYMAAAADGHLYLFGGWVSNAGSYSNSMYRYDIAAGRWDLLSPPGPRPTARGHGGAAMTLDGLFYIFAGEQQGAGMLNDLWMFDTRYHYWSRCDGSSGLDCCPASMYAANSSAPCQTCPGCVSPGSQSATCCTDGFTSHTLPPVNSTGPCVLSSLNWQTIIEDEMVSSWTGGLGLLISDNLTSWACVNRTGQHLDRRCPGMAQDGLACYVYREVEHPAGPGFVYWGRDAKLKVTGLPHHSLPSP